MAKYESDKDETLWTYEWEDVEEWLNIDIVVKVMSYDGGTPKVSLARCNKSTGAWTKLGRLTQPECEFLMKALAEAGQFIVKHVMNNGQEETAN